MTWIEPRSSVAEPPPTATSSTTRSDRTSATDLRDRRDEVQNVFTTPEPTSLPPRQTDWNAHAAYNARKAVEDATTERYRNLGPRQPGPQAEPSAPSMFAPPEKSLGELGTDIDDNPVVWLNKDCYFELDKLILTARDIVNPGLPPMMKCKFNVGKREARGDLFEHLRRPLPEPKPGAPSELPERDDE